MFKLLSSFPPIRNLTSPWLKHLVDFKDQKKIIVKNQPLIFDVGASVGQSTEKYLFYFPNSMIHSFEPIPKVYKEYVNKFSNYKNINANNFALSDKNGTADFYVNDCHYTSSMLKPVPFSKRFSHENDIQFQLESKMSIKTVTLDRYCNNSAIDFIDILKIDTQGSELSVLEGARKMLNNHSINLIFAEVEFIALYEQQPLFYDIRRWLNEKGYFLNNLYNLNVNKSMQLESADALFVSNRFANQL